MNHMSEEAMAERHFGPKKHQALKGENATFRGPGDNDIIQNYMRHLMGVLGISTHARPVSPHDVFISEIIPKVIQLIADTEKLLMALKHSLWGGHSQAALGCEGCELIGTILAQDSKAILQQRRSDKLPPR